METLQPKRTPGVSIIQQDHQACNLFHVLWDTVKRQTILLIIRTSMFVMAAGQVCCVASVLKDTVKPFILLPAERKRNETITGSGWPASSTLWPLHFTSSLSLLSSHCYVGIVCGLTRNPTIIVQTRPLTKTAVMDTMTGICRSPSIFIKLLNW